jgi:hypothetical protein
VSDFPIALTEKLIELVKIYPILYDLSHEDYKNVRKKDKVWDVGVWTGSIWLRIGIGGGLV